MLASVVLIGIIGGSLAPIFYELGIEVNYPISEIVTVSTMSLMYNIFPTLFLLVFLIPDIGEYSVHVLTCTAMIS